MGELAGRTALVTGASRGIGRSTALRLASLGCRVALSARDRDRLAMVSEAITAGGGPPPCILPADLSDKQAVARLVPDTLDRLGQLDVLINNAGFNTRKAAIVELEAEELDRMLAVNLRAPMLLARDALAHMAERKQGHIVNILSTVCHLGMPTMGGYSAGKWGLWGFTKVLIKEAREDQVKVSAVFPGGTDTDFRAADRPDYLAPDSVAEAIARVVTMPDDLIVHELTFRPMVESNF